MNRAAIGITAAGFLLFGLACVMTDMSAGSQRAAVVFFTLAGLVLIIGIISESGGARHSSGDTTQTVNVYMPAQQQAPAQQPQFIPVYIDRPVHLPPQYAYACQTAPKIDP